MTADVLTFEPVAHVYRIGDREIPSVTTILRAVGLIRFDGIPARVLEAARDRGTRVHTAAQYLTEGLLDWSSVAEDDRGFVEAAARFLADSGFLPTAQEVRLYSARHGYAGTTDLLGYWHGTPAIADYKTGDPDNVAAQYQLAAYELAVREAPPIEWLDFTPRTPVVRLSVALRRDGTYRAHSYTSARDFQVWLAALAVFRAQKGNG